LIGPDPIPHLSLTHICDRRARDKRARESEPLSDLSWTDRFDDLLASDTDVIVEAVSAGEPAADYVRAALLAGKSVVTASRQVMAHQGPALLTLAERQGRQVRYEAAVGGAMPIVRVLGDGLAGDTILQVDAILNGTSNAVLSRMEATGCTVDEAIAEACASGYTESDPSVDLDGLDAADKLAIICRLAFGVFVLPSAIETRSAGHIGVADLRRARQRNAVIRQLAHASYSRASGVLTAWVGPTFVAETSIFARTTGARNAAVIQCRHAGEITVTGPGAGGDAVAVAVIGDIRAIARDRAAIVPAPALVEAREIKGLSEQTYAEAV
jgi:homoserine dehydrogenase